MRSSIQVLKKKYKDDLELRAHLKNDSATIDDPDELDKFMLISNYCFKFSIWYHEEIQSKDNKKRNKYTRGQILTNLTTLEYEIQK